MTTWSVVFERTATGWSAYVPALPGLAVTAATRGEAERLIREGIPFHLEGLAEEGHVDANFHVESCDMARV